MCDILKTYSCLAEVVKHNFGREVHFMNQSAVKASDTTGFLITVG